MVCFVSFALGAGSLEYCVENLAKDMSRLDVSCRVRGLSQYEDCAKIKPRPLRVQAVQGLVHGKLLRCKQQLTRLGDRRVLRCRVALTRPILAHVALRARRPGLDP